MKQRTLFEARDEALDALENTRGELIAIAFNVAVMLAKRHGQVTSVDVFEEMQKQGYGPDMEPTDPRWMGCVFARKPCWHRVGYVSKGSKGRPVSVWTYRDGKE